MVMGDGKEIARLVEAELANTPDAVRPHTSPPEHDVFVVDSQKQGTLKMNARAAKAYLYLGAQCMRP